MAVEARRLLLTKRVPLWDAICNWGPLSVTVVRLL